MSRRKTARKPAELLFDRWLLGMIADSARKWCPRDAALSAFLSEIATVPSLRRYLP